jgi:hypothetical protein
LSLLTAIEVSLGGSTDKKVRKHIHKRNNTKNTVQIIQNKVNKSTHITKSNTHYKTHTYTPTHFKIPHIHKPTHYKTSKNNHIISYNNNIYSVKLNNSAIWCPRARSWLFVLGSRPATYSVYYFVCFLLLSLLRNWESCVCVCVCVGIGMWCTKFHHFKRSSSPTLLCTYLLPTNKTFAISTDPQKCANSVLVRELQPRQAEARRVEDRKFWSNRTLLLNHVCKFCRNFCKTIANADRVLRHVCLSAWYSSWALTGCILVKLCEYINKFY